MCKISIGRTLVILLLSIFTKMGIGQKSHFGFKANLSHYISVVGKDRVFWNIPPSKHQLTNETIEGNKESFSPHIALNFIYGYKFYERKKVEFSISFGLGYFFSFKEIKWRGTGTDNFGYQKSFAATYKSQKQGITVPVLFHCSWHSVSFSSGIFFHGIANTKNYFLYSSNEQLAPFEITDNGSFASPTKSQRFFLISLPFSIGYTFNISRLQRVNISLEYYLGVFDSDSISVGIVPARQKTRNDFLGIGFTYEYHLKFKSK